MADVAVTSDNEAKQPVRPTLFKMILEALAGNTSNKGLSLQAIKNHVAEIYPETKEGVSKSRWHTAMRKGLTSGEIIRPKSSDSEGMVGRFLLNRALTTKKEQKKKIDKAAKTHNGKADNPSTKPRPTKVTKSHRPKADAATGRKASASKSLAKSKSPKSFKSPAKSKAVKAAASKSKAAKSPKKAKLPIQAKNSKSAKSPKSPKAKTAATESKAKSPTTTKVPKAKAK